MAYFYEIRGDDNTVLKWNGGFADPEVAKMEARAEAKKIRESCLRQGSDERAPQASGPDVVRILLGRKLQIPHK